MGGVPFYFYLFFKLKKVTTQTTQTTQTQMPNTVSNKTEKCVKAAFLTTTQDSTQTTQTQIDLAAVCPRRPQTQMSNHHKKVYKPDHLEM